MISCLAAGVISSRSLRSSTSFVTRAIWRSTILARSWSSGRKMMTSSTRFRNSGLNVCRSSSSTLVSACSHPLVPASSKFCEPRFDVMMSTLLRKSTVRPCASVRRPSSRICSNTLKTSGCAFSISSNRITAYGRRRTASVSWPPSS